MVNLARRRSAVQAASTILASCDVLLSPRSALVPDVLTWFSLYIRTRIASFPPVRHFSELLQHFGPLCHVWTMRFESKHQYFKECIRSVRNYKNVTKTVFLKDWTLLEEDVFQDVLKELPLDDRIFIVAEVIPPVEHDSSGISQADCVTIFEEEVSTPQFNFHFERLPRSVQVALEAPQALPPGERRDLVRCIAHDMMQVSPRPRREFIRSVAEAVVKRFPACLQDRTVSGKVFGRGYDSLFQQLENRVENLGRVKQQELPSCVKTKKYSYGCANWQPVCLQPVETIAEKIQFLKGEAQKTLRDIDVPLAQTCMDATYSEQRRFINSDAPVHSTAEVREEWPLLFHKSFFYKHACQLLGKNMRGIFEENLSGVAPLFIKHLDTLTAPRKELVQWMVKVELQERKGNQHAKEEATIPLLAAYFKDDPDDLFRVLEEGTSITEVMDEFPSTPVVVSLGGIFKKKCFVVCEQQLLFTESTGFIEAACLAFLCYYVFNMTYAKGAATTLEFIQRQICDINPCKGSRSQGNARRLAIPTKVVKLAQLLRKE
ncbi:uncharacterized protein [Dermacentor albipictus]